MVAELFFALSFPLYTYRMFVQPLVQVGGKMNAAHIWLTCPRLWPKMSLSTPCFCRPLSCIFIPSDSTASLNRTHQNLWAACPPCRQMPWIMCGRTTCTWSCERCRQCADFPVSENKETCSWISIVIVRNCWMQYVQVMQRSHPSNFCLWNVQLRSLDVAFLHLGQSRMVRALHISKLSKAWHLDIPWGSCHCIASV